MVKKHLLLSEIFPPKTGGSGRWFWDLYTRIGHEKVVIVTDKIESSALTDKNSGLIIYRTRLANKSWGVVSLSGLFHYILMVRYVYKLIKKYDIECIHCGRTLPEGVIAMAVKFLSGTPYYCYVHGEDIEMCRTSREFVFLVRCVIKNANKLICNSQNSASLLRQWWNAKEEQIHVLYPGVDASVFKPSEEPLKQTVLPEKKIILTVSRLQPRKGQDVLIKAMPAILKQHPDAVYVIVGSGDQENYLKEMITSMNLSDAIYMQGECSDAEIIQWYQRSDLFVLPNRQIGNDVEGFGIVLLEAQACATPVIAGDSGGTRETMEIGKTGYILDCQTPEHLSKLISDLFDNPGQLAEMGSRARQRILKQFDWPKIVASAISMFEVND